jgi:hypothetical protein
MKTPEEEKLFLENVNGLLNDGIENLDRRIQQRLEHARIEALKPAPQKRAEFFIPLRWAMVGGFATIIATAAALLFWLPTAPVVLPAKHIEDLEIITSAEHIDFYQNLDFYLWLATKEDSSRKGKTS